MSTWTLNIFLKMKVNIQRGYISSTKEFGDIFRLDCRLMHLLKHAARSDGEASTITSCNWFGPFAI